MRRCMPMSATCAVVSLLAALAAPARAQQTPRPAADIPVYRAHQLDADQPRNSFSVDGIWELTSISGQPLPVQTPSTYGAIQSGRMAIQGDRYVLVYVYGRGQQLRIDGTVATRGTRVVELRPTTPGIAGSTFTFRDGELVTVVDGGFGIRNARFVFAYKGPLSGPAPAPAPQPRPAPDPEPAPGAACTAARGGNLVEPLSNGLQLSATLDDIREQFGQGQASWDARTVTYSGFRVAVGGRDEKIWHFHVTGPGVCLASGIGFGSSRTDVQRVFGRSYGATYGQYKLTFQYDGDRLVDIGIDPTGEEFAPARGGSPAPAPGPAPKPAPAPSPGPKPGAGGSSAILGKWWGVQSMTQIDVNADGTYTSPNGGKGTWRMTGDDIVFTGALAGWNNGHARYVKGSWIEFSWQDAAGYKYLFQLIRR